MDYAPAVSAVRGPDEVGELASLARQALLPRKERIDEALRMRELLQEAAPTNEAAARVQRGPAEAERLSAHLDAAVEAGWQRLTGDRTSAASTTYPQVAPQLREAAPQTRGAQLAENTQPQLPDTLRPRQLPSFADLAPLKGGLQGDIPPGRDGDMLRQVAAEVRALRDDLRSLSRVLGFAPRGGPEFRGVLQQFDHLDSNVRARAFRESSEELDYQEQRRELRAEGASEVEQQAVARQEERQREVQLAIRSQQAMRIATRQRELLRALQRAQRQLASVPPEEVPVGLREEVIGEIYKARYSIAVFGGAMGGGQLAGLAFSASY